MLGGSGTGCRRQTALTISTTRAFPNSDRPSSLRRNLVQRNEVHGPLPTAGGSARGGVDGGDGAPHPSSRCRTFRHAKSLKPWQRQG